ncbi:MAG: aldo/keto reductase [Verrucomicrobia bacterium]|nr:aldo/keto reductase [Verrucomicrobiota bacterium]
MQYRTFPKTDLQVSTVGFGVWTISTGWWGQYTDDEAVALLRQGFDAGMTLFDAADTYGCGRSEELLAKAFPDRRRDEVVIATKIGYDFTAFGNDKRRGQMEFPHDFSPAALRQATDAALRRLRTDRVDLMQLHNISMPEVEDDAIWETMEELQRAGKIRYYGMALGPAIGWLYEGIRCIERRNPTSVQHIYNLFEQHPGAALQQSARDSGSDTGFLVRVPHASGMLEGRYTAETTFPDGDHRRHRPRAWLQNGLKRVENIRFLEQPGRTLGQAALQWLLVDERCIATLPNIYNAAQIAEFAQAPDSPALTQEELDRLAALHAINFGAPEDEVKYKGTMTLEPAGAA